MSNTATDRARSPRKTTVVGKTTTAAQGLTASGDVDGGSGDGGGDLTNLDSRTSAALEATRTPLLLLGPRSLGAAKAR